MGGGWGLEGRAETAVEGGVEWANVDVGKETSSLRREHERGVGGWEVRAGEWWGWGYGDSV